MIVVLFVRYWTKTAISRLLISACAKKRSGTATQPKHFVATLNTLPPKSLTTIFMVTKNFGGKVFRHAEKGFGCVAILDLLFAQTEISNLGMAVLAQ